MATFRKPLGLLIDLSGTIHVEDKAISRSVEAVSLLRRKNIPFLFVTNTTKESVNDLCRRLNLIGFDIKCHEIFSSLSAAHDLVKARNLRPLLLLSDSAMEDFIDINQEDPNAVVVGLAPEKFNYGALTQAFRLIKAQNAPLIAIHKARYFAAKDGLSLGPGCFVTGLEYSADVTAEVVGKPAPTFFHQALQKLNSANPGSNLRAEDVCMIGDDVRDDVMGAQKAGFQGCLVKSGKYREGDEKMADQLTYLKSSFAETIEEWYNSNTN